MNDDDHSLVPMRCIQGPWDLQIVTARKRDEFVDLEDLTQAPFAHGQDAPLARFVRYRVSRLASDEWVLIYDGEGA